MSKTSTACWPVSPTARLSSGNPIASDHEEKHTGPRGQLAPRPTPSSVRVRTGYSGGAIFHDINLQLTKQI